MMNFSRAIPAVLISFLALFISCSKVQIPVARYYDYDPDLPLVDSVRLLKDTSDHSLFYLSYRSVHDREVTGLLAIPKHGEQALPTVLLMHGLGDRKTVDYMEAGNRYLLDAGYAVLRLDISNHGDRFKYDYEFNLTDGYRYWTRDLVVQTVFDLRRAVDFIQTREELDPQRIGYMGISLGGIIGGIFCSVDERVEVPVLVLAGGNLNLMLREKALSRDTREFFSIIDPVNYIAGISPRPLLMINAEQDDVIPPVMSRLLFKAAKKPKEIIWHPSKHHDLPVDKTYAEGIQWFDQYLKDAS